MGQLADRHVSQLKHDALANFTNSLTGNAGFFLSNPPSGRESATIAEWMNSSTDRTRPDCMAF
jgi:hypothetical protein